MNLPRRRRVRDRLDIPEQIAQTSQDTSAWATDLASVLAKASMEKGRTWQQRRDRVRRALGTIRLALADHPEIRRSEILDDILLLELALAGLNTGEIHSIVRSGPRGNRLPDSVAKIQLRRVILQCCEHLIASNISRANAYAFVAGLLYDQGLRAPRSKSDGAAGLASLLKRWYQATLRGHTGVAERPDDAKWLERWAIKTPATDPSVARENVRKWLGEPLVRGLMPEVRKGEVLTH